MRQPRIKISPEQGDASYHCMSRTVNGERLFDPVAREMLRKQIWKTAEYCGVQIVTYVILSNHFHLLVRVPRKTKISDAELLRRYAVLYPRPTRYQAARLDVIRRQLATNAPPAVNWRRRQLALMGDLSPFMKLVKQRFSVWFNKTHGRFGTLWAERFKSILVQSGPILRTIAAYVDLNSVRAGLVPDPKDYRYCGYAEAVAGHQKARAGLTSVLGDGTWEELQAGYRLILFGTEGGELIPLETVQKVLQEGGRLPLATLLRCRVRYFSDGAVIGSQAFVTEQLAAYRRKTGRRENIDPRTLPPLADWGELCTLRGLRGSTISRS